MQDEYSLHNIVLISKLFVIEAELLNKIGRHLLHLIIRKGLARPRANDNDIVLALQKAGHYLQYKKQQMHIHIYCCHYKECITSSSPKRWDTV